MANITRDDIYRTVSIPELKRMIKTYWWAFRYVNDNMKTVDLIIYAIRNYKPQPARLRYSNIYNKIFSTIPKHIQLNPKITLMMYTLCPNKYDNQSLINQYYESSIIKKVGRLMQDDLQSVHVEMNRILDIIKTITTKYKDRSKHIDRNLYSITYYIETAMKEMKNIADE